MNLNNRLSKLKSELLIRIQEAARKNDTESIFVFTKYVQEIERIIKRLEEMIIAIDNLEKNVNSILHPKQVDVPHIPESIYIQGTPRKLSPKMKGKLRRKEFIQKLQRNGINLRPKRGVTYITAAGGLVGISYAFEKRPDRWFFGIKSDDYHSIVALCDKKNEQILSFVIPKPFINNLKEKLTYEDGQMKFNIILREPNDYYLLIPDDEAIEISELLDNYDCLS